MIRRSFLVAAGALILPACVSKPTMELHHAEIRGADLNGVHMEVFFTVHNDNSFDVQVRNVRVTTKVQDRWTLPQVSYSPNQWLPAHNTVMVSAPCVIPWPLVTPLLAETVSSSTIDYHVSGSADVTAIRSVGIKSDNYPVDEDGKIPRIAVLQAARTAMPIPF